MSLDMLNYLCREKIVEPGGVGKRGRGRRRAFAFGDIVLLKAIAKLLDGGVSVLRLKRAFASLRKYHPEFKQKGASGGFLVTDGRDIYLREQDGVVELLVRRQLEFVFVVEIDSLWRDATAFASAKSHKVVRSEVRKTPIRVARGNR